MLPKTTPDQRSRFYEDVESLLTPGFLTHRVAIGGVRLQMRSLSPGDVFMLRARAEGGESGEWRLWATATSVWMVDGRSLLARDEAVPYMHDFLQRLPKNAQEVLFTILLGLFARAGRAGTAVENYCLEQHSRFRWKTYGGQIRTSSGVPGAESLGANVVQRIWTAFNEVEDRHLAEENAWEGFKLVASSNAPKAVKKLDSRDVSRRREDQEKRQKQLDRFYYTSLGVLDAKGTVVGVPGDPGLGGPKSVEDLEDEMRRWVAGEHDQHDRVVADYKARIVAVQERERAEREARKTALEVRRKEIESSDVGWSPGSVVGLTLEQLQAVLSERGGTRPGTSFVTTGPPGGGRSYVYEKYLQHPETAGNLAVTDGGGVTDPNADSETDVRTLNELVRARKVGFGEGN